MRERGAALPVTGTLERVWCERASQARDPRFDGRFFIAVLTTRIYCRPICPVQPPLPSRVLYYPSAAAAEAAGYRPCRRCRPEAAPGTPAWAGTGATVARALRLIEQGALDGEGVDRLARRLGVGERYLRKLFETQVGASPVAVAQVRRLQQARRLLDETRLAVSRVAEAAGFGSLRRFHTAFQEAYGCPPSKLREERTRPADTLRLRIPCREPWPWAQLEAHLGLRQLHRVETLAGGVYTRTFRLGASAGWLRVRPLEDAAALELCMSPVVTGELPVLVGRVRRMLDLDADPGVIAAHLGSDPLLAPLVRRWPGLRLVVAFDPFEQLVRTVVGQQVAVRAAVTVVGRLVERLGEPLREALPGGPDRLFPTPEAIAEGDLEGLGLPGRRAETLRALARGVVKGELHLGADAGPGQVREGLARIPGVGPWTLEYAALRAFGEPDAFPASDLGLLNAPVWGPSRPSVRSLETRAQAWRPWRAYAAHYLWQSYAERSRPGRKVIPRLRRKEEARALPVSR